MENKKMTATQFLEKHKIWFNTVLSFALTCAAVMISIASYNVSKYQAHLNERSINNLDLEKQPYFSVENKYVEDENEYTYLIRNTGGDIRYTSIYLIPYLYIERKENGKYAPSNYAFVELPGVYRNCEIQSEDNILFAFKDYVFTDGEENILADDLFRYYVSWDNIGGMDTSMSSQIIYRLQVSYVNYKNEYNVDMVTFSRSSDISEKTEGNKILNIDVSKRFLPNNMQNMYSIDSLNLTDTEIKERCEKLIENIRHEFGQTEAAQKYMDANYH